MQGKMSWMAFKQTLTNYDKVKMKHIELKCSEQLKVSDQMHVMHSNDAIKFKPKHSLTVTLSTQQSIHTLQTSLPYSDLF